MLRCPNCSSTNVKRETGTTAAGGLFPPTKQPIIELIGCIFVVVGFFCFVVSRSDPHFYATVDKPGASLCGLGVILLFCGCIESHSKYKKWRTRYDRWRLSRVCLDCRHVFVINQPSQTKEQITVHRRPHPQTTLVPSDPGERAMEQKREVPKDDWGLMQRVYGLKHHILWPGQYSLGDMFKHMTLLCIGLSILATAVKVISWLANPR
jgi:hypothetical protein